MAFMSLPKIVVVVGPTASGKTDVGIAIARRFDGEVVAADSRTVCRGMDIGTAKIQGKRIPVPEAQYVIHSLFAEKPIVVDGIAHWGFDLVNPDKTFTVSDYHAYADKKITDIIARGKLPVVVGGTGLYVRALIDRPTYSDVAPNADVRAELDGMTTQALVDEIGDRDPDALATLDEGNRPRLVRALEILRQSGKTLADARGFEPSIYDALQLGIDVARETLYERIDRRVDDMIANGLVDEVRVLRERYGGESPAMTGIGYRQIGAFFDGKMTLRDAVVRIKYDTRHYAKRQETWFRRDTRVQWVRTADEAIAAVNRFV